MKYSDFTLRPATEADLPILLKWRNSDLIRPFMTNGRIITWGEHEKWFKGLADDTSKKELIFEYQGTPIGQLTVSDIDHKNSTAYWGYSRGEEDAPRGSGTAMEYLALAYIFEVLGIRKLCGELFSFNTKVIKVHEKFGWEEEGRLRKHCLKGEDYEDVICIAMFNFHWQLIRDEMREQIFEEE
ncbi:MAG TPA: UDP-4-amino-4,6-dideoxy-N-acetyl-beta-L-altrosamine N-acetyltransferase [bacterium]|nr:UDP-4-amino-4,6-dideoxy-N-acetyl-beta-L-altrosamine N-acetyltransferase [bacterium]